MNRTPSPDDITKSSAAAALKITAAYVLIGALWILIADSVLPGISSSELPEKVASWQTFKGWAFIFLSAVGLYFLSRHFLLTEQRGREAFHEMEERLRARQLQSQRDQAVIGALGHELAAADTLEKLGQAILKTITNLWPWDAFFFSVRQSGEGRVRSVLQVDTIDGVRKFFPPHR